VVRNKKEVGNPWPRVLLVSEYPMLRINLNRTINQKIVFKFPLYIFSAFETINISHAPAYLKFIERLKGDEQQPINELGICCLIVQLTPNINYIRTMPIQSDVKE
jgi:hypothetical protein